jgi:hypothetical protein
MRKYTSLVLCANGAVLAALSMLSGCAGGEEKKPDDAPVVERRAPKKDKKGGAVDTRAELEAPTNGVLKGRVELEGTPPQIEKIMAMATHADSKVCLAGSDAETQTQTWILAPDKKGVANVVIKLLPPDGKKFKNLPPASKQAVIDQPHCAFVPHVLALVPGQVLLIKNSAKVPHNTKLAGDPLKNSDIPSVTIPAGGEKVLELNPQLKPIEIKCDFHSWMSAQLYVNDSPYIAVTKEDGTFEIPNVPTGVELTVVGIHEGGDVGESKQGQKMNLKAGDNPLDLKVKPR